MNGSPERAHARVLRAAAGTACFPSAPFPCVIIRRASRPLRCAAPRVIEADPESRFSQSPAAQSNNNSGGGATRKAGLACASSSSLGPSLAPR